MYNICFWLCFFIIVELGDTCSKSSDCSGVIDGTTCKDGFCKCDSGFKALLDECIEDTATVDEQG